MKAQNVVVRYQDGRLLKGTTLDFNPPGPTFHVRLADAGEDVPGVLVNLNELKAVFFVRDLAGDRTHVDRKRFDKDQPFTGRKVTVTFVDGEVVVGWTLGYGESGPGFFLFPADTQCNSQRMYVVTANARSVALVQP